MKINRRQNGVFAYLSLMLIIGFPRIYGTEVPMAFLLLPFYMADILNFISRKALLFVCFFILSLLWLVLGCGSYFNAEGISQDLYFHCILFVKLVMNIVFGLVTYTIIKNNPKAMLAWFISQCLIIILSIFYYPFYIFLLGFISPRSAEIFSLIFGLRAVGFGLFHVDGAFLLTTAGFYYCIIRDTKFINAILISLLFPISMMVARSAIIPYIGFSILRSNFRAKIVLILSIALMFLLSCIIFSGPLYEALEIFRNFLSVGTLRSASTDNLSTMYVYPQSLETYLIGDGRYFGDLSAGLSFYKSTDVGYLRLIYYSGVFSLMLFILLNIYFLLPIIFGKKIKRGDFKINLFALGLLFSFIILNFKGIQMSSLFVTTLYFLYADLKTSLSRKNAYSYPSEICLGSVNNPTTLSSQRILNNP